MFPLFLFLVRVWKNLAIIIFCDKEPACQCRKLRNEGSIPRSGRSPGGGRGNPLQYYSGFPAGASGKKPACQCRRHKRQGVDPWVGKIPWRKAWQPPPVVLPGESQGQRSLESQTQLKRLSMHACMHVLWVFGRTNSLMKPSGSVPKGIFFPLWLILRFYIWL